MSSNGWISYNTGSIDATINSSNLIFADYPSISGNSVFIGDDGLDYYKNFSQSVSSGTIYCSFLINVSSATTSTSIYVLSLGANNSSLSGRFYVSKSGSSLAFGISKGSSSASFTNYLYQLNTTYLIVLKYIINSGTKNDDVALFVFDSTIPNIEPIPTLTHATETTNDPTNIFIVTIRQDATTNDILIDGIRVSDSWSQAPLPVELTSFTAIAGKNGVQLNWSTATEVNNYGFEIERCVAQISNLCNNWEKIGFVQGHGNSNSPKDYLFVDANPPAGKVLYKLKQIDFDGTFEYSNVVEVNVDTPQEFRLAQNYPNPFNPSTVINYQLPVDGNVTLKIYDMLGNEVATLVNQYQKAGSYNYTFSILHYTLSSGVYYYRLQSGNFVETKKFMLMK